MKLIDLEKINLDNSLIEIITDMINQPIIDAIPIEWLKKWANDNSNGEWSIEYRTVFNGILKDWEKENEV